MQQMFLFLTEKCLKIFKETAFIERTYGMKNWFLCTLFAKEIINKCKKYSLKSITIILVLTDRNFEAMDTVNRQNGSVFSFGE